MFVADRKSAELTEPGIGSLHDPAQLVTPHFSSVVVALPLVVLAARCDQFDGPLLQKYIRNRRFEDKRKLCRYRKRWKISRTNA